ncbi:MAG: glycosyl hydrolase 115 family protein [Verrucomicrobiota bacterium]|jgi:hypothetical protein
MKSLSAAVWLTLPLCLGLRPALAIGEAPYVSTHSSAGSFALAAGGSVPSIYVDTNEFWGVARAAGDLQADLQRVTGVTPALTHDEKLAGANVILIGALGQSRLIDQLAREGAIDSARIAGKWESFLVQVVPHPLPGVKKALVIAGSDKRGTIYGIYDLSQQMGVSPWSWWTDVPVRHHDALFVKAGAFVQGPPAVKYRGIFLNDEAPDLTGWAHEKFGGYNHAFYTNIFQLLLRLKANYLWPAMWDNCFSEDDPLNPKLANDYGIVMGTSHVEPMMRADKEWNRKGYTAAQWNYDKNPSELRAFWREGIQRNKPYENIITIAMRGKIDTPMSQSANIALLEKIVGVERDIIRDVLETNAASVPQLWALYKEVQEYYEKGMRVPDDVTLLWCDDNWGNIRRLPTPEERGRAGGAGIYYHLDYVGGPRNYKWLNSTPITKVWEQMNLALNYGADRIWIVNVGHLHHVTFPAEFFLTLAWDPARWPKERISEFTRLWAEREFGPAHAPEIAQIMAQYTRFNGRRKPELLDQSTFSLIDYQEADSVLADWKSLATQAEGLERELPQEARDAFYELVLHPVKACAVVNELYIAAAKSRLYASQGRASANDCAAQARALFQADADLSSYFNHTLAHGKWDHMMDQTHIGYTYWQEPPSNSMPKVAEIKIPREAALGVAVEGSTNAWPGSPEPAALPPFDAFSRGRHYLDVFNRGQTPFAFTASAGAPWIRLSATHGTVAREQRIWVDIDWSRAPKGRAEGGVEIQSAGAGPVTVHIYAFQPREPSRGSLRGFVEAGGCVSIEAGHYTRKVDTAGARWEEIDEYGRTLSAMAIFPPTAASLLPPAGAPCLEYRMYLFDTGKVKVESILAPTLSFVPGRGLRYAISFDDQPPQVVDALAHNTLRDWETSVKDSVRKVASDHTISQPGYHTLKFRMIDPGIVLEKLVVDFGGARPSYLGPPETYHR